MYGKDDKGISNFFKEANNRDVLGLRPMNNRISEILFPECTTLMPNLVYIYYLNAIYHVLKEKGSEDDIDYYERMISHHIVEKHREECKGKGFFDDAKDRAYKKYKNKMKMLHYLDEGYSINNVCLLDILKETDRYRFVKNVIDNVEVGSDVEDLTDYEKGCIYSPGKLDEIEKLDYIRRVLMPDDSRICRYSYTSNIIASFLVPKSNKREDPVSKIYQKGKDGKFEYKKLEELLEELKIKQNSKSLYEFVGGLVGDDDGDAHAEREVVEHADFEVDIEFVDDAFVFEFVEQPHLLCRSLVVLAFELCPLVSLREFWSQ